MRARGGRAVRRRVAAPFEHDGRGKRLHFAHPGLREGPKDFIVRRRGLERQGLQDKRSNRRKRRRASLVVAAEGQDPHPLQARIVNRGRGEPGLADAGLADQRDRAAPFDQRLLENAPFQLAPNDRKPIVAKNAFRRFRRRGRSEFVSFQPDVLQAGDAVARRQLRERPAKIGSSSNSAGSDQDGRFFAASPRDAPRRRPC